VCMLKEGEIIIDSPEGERERWQTTGGTMTVEREQVTVLVHSATREEG